MKWSRLLVLLSLAGRVLCTPLEDACAALAVDHHFYDGSCWWKSAIGSKTYANLVALSPDEYCNDIAGGHLAQVMTARVHQELSTTTVNGITPTYYRAGLYRHNQTTAAPYLNVGWWWFDYFSMPPVLEAHDENTVWNIANTNAASYLDTRSVALDGSYKTDGTTAAKAVLCQIEEIATHKRFVGSVSSRNRRLKTASVLVLSENWTSGTVAVCQVACARNRFCYSYTYSADTKHCQMHKPMPKGHNNHVESAMGYEWRDLTY